MSLKWAKICCHTETKNKLMNDCKAIFLKSHPEFKDFNITEDFILRKVITFYIEA